MSFSLMAEGLLRHILPDSGWSPSVVSLGYCLGFVIVILGRQQLFTENTLTAVIPLMHRKNLPTAGNLLRLWGIVLPANLIGAWAVDWVLANTNSFDQPICAAFAEIGQEALRLALRPCCCAEFTPVG